MRHISKTWTLVGKVGRTERTMANVSRIKRLRRRIDAAQGRIPCDLIVRGVRYLDVFSCEWKNGDLAVVDGTIVGVEPGLRARRMISGKGKWAVPGFIDAHVHVESSLLVPGGFRNAVLPRGTTSAVCDPHELANVAGVRGIRYFLEQASRLDLDLRVMLSSCVPATHLETNGAGTLSAGDLLPLARHPKALGLAEVMNVPGVLGAERGLLRKLAGFEGRPIDGHCPLLSGDALSAYAAAGISSCHESSRLPEAREKVSKGISVWIREGSVAKDLDALAPLLSLATSTSVGFCTDDRNPLDIAEEGHIDHLVRRAIRHGIPREVAYRAASWSVARHYGMDRGSDRVGALAPGWRADVVLLDDPGACAVGRVLKSGRLVEDTPEASAEAAGFRGTVRVRAPEASELVGPAGRVHVIRVKHGQILTGRAVRRHDARGVARLSVLERHGKSGALANGYVEGFGPDLRGAIATSVGHDSHNLIVTGSDPRDMRVALAALIESGGGFCVAGGGKVLSRLELPVGGLMSAEDPHVIRRRLAGLKSASRAIGCVLPEPFLQLAFLSLPVIPSLKLTDQGLVDVDAFRIIDVRA